jgi:hypothetical protein
VGTGRANTQTIANKGGFGLAAQACEALTINGFDDWFLPSRDELGYMYDNLKQRGLGNFKNEEYWSSSCDPYDDFWVRNFSDGYGGNYRRGYSSQLSVRAIRQF